MLLIAYRNAYNTYQNSYSLNFGVVAPEQLKKDLLRTAYLNGFTDELLKYERDFGIKYKHKKQLGGELFFFWNNGLGPVKGEWSINFTVVKGSGGNVTFVNEDLGLNFPFYAGNPDEKGNGGLGDLKIVRVAFPKYLVRKPLYKQANLELDSTFYPLEKAENIEGIALSTLEDRMLRELAKAVARLAVKQASELAARKENADTGAIVSIVNALTEKADTRNWQTLPNTISYARIPLKTGVNKIKLITRAHSGDKSSKSEEFIFEAEEGQKLFHVFHSFESGWPTQP